METIGVSRIVVCDNISCVRRGVARVWTLPSVGPALYDGYAPICSCGWVVRTVGENAIITTKDDPDAVNICGEEAIGDHHQWVCNLQPHTHPHHRWIVKKKEATDGTETASGGSPPRAP